MARLLSTPGKLAAQEVHAVVSLLTKYRLRLLFCDNGTCIASRGTQEAEGVSPVHAVAAWIELHGGNEPECDAERALLGIER